MPKSHKIAAALMTLLSGIAVWCFFALKYPYHLHFQEQYQLFESTREYFCTVVAVPGGLADWLGRFLTQFFYYAPAGAAILAVLVAAVQLLSFAACGRKNLVTYALSFLPAAFLTAFFCDENALAGGAAAIILSLAAAALCRLVRKDSARRILETLLVPVLYMVSGGLAVTFVLIVIVNEAQGRGFLPYAAAMLVLAVICPVAAAHVFPYPAERLAYGVHYHRYHNMMPGMLWISGICTVLASLAGLLRSSRAMLPAGAGIFVLAASLGAVLTVKSADMSKEEWMKYDFMVRMKMWNRIMMEADRKAPGNPTTVSCLNLALSMSGRMSDHQFDYFQNGPDGLLPPFTRSHTTPVSTGEIYWQLGMVNTAQRFAFEAQEGIPDFQKSARLYMRLAQTNIVNGDWDVARKYLRSLSHATFYRKRALELTAWLDSGEIFEKDAELSRARDFRLKEHDFLFSDTEMDSMLGLLNVENPSNTMAVDYLMAWCLLKKDLDRFVECVPLIKDPIMPKHYQEALLLRWVLTHQDFNGIPSYLSPIHAQRMDRFIKDAQGGKKEDYMRKNYGDTYWFYYYYRYRAQ